MNEPIIKVDGLAKEFQLKQKTAGFWGGIVSLFRPVYRKVKAVDSVSFSVNAGEVVAFIGPNGAGKSTTIKMLTGILYPSGGHISVLGFDPTRQRQKLAYHIGTVFGQKPQLWYHLPPMDTYNLLARIYELDPIEYRKRLDMLVEAFELGDLLQTPVRKLSLGQRMRCEIAASLLHKPKIILLDEPTIGLDVIAKQQIRKTIKFLNEQEGVTIFLTSHDAGDIEALAHRAIVINSGTVVFDGPTDELKRNYMRTKIIELVTQEPISGFSFPGGTVISQSEFSIKVELDTSHAAIDKLLAYAVEQFDIKDINIFDPPMEEIIADIYRAQKA